MMSLLRVRAGEGLGVEEPSLSGFQGVYFSYGPPRDSVDDINP